MSPETCEIKFDKIVKITHPINIVQLVDNSLKINEILLPIKVKD
jgi:hypothetical protein